MPDSLNSQEEAQYYSSWQFSAVHVLLSIPEFQTRDAISKKLELSLERVDKILSFLEEAGLCKKEGQSHQITRPLLHLDKWSPLISKHHTNWRLKSILSLDKEGEDDLHYSSVFTLSMNDYSCVKEILTNALADSFNIISKSPEKDTAVICLDLFKL